MGEGTIRNKNAIDLWPAGNRDWHCQPHLWDPSWSDGRGPRFFICFGSIWNKKEYFQNVVPPTYGTSKFHKLPAHNFLSICVGGFWNNDIRWNLDRHISEKIWNHIFSEMVYWFVFIVVNDWGEIWGAASCCESWARSKGNASGNSSSLGSTLSCNAKFGWK